MTKTRSAFIALAIIYAIAYIYGAHIKAFGGLQLICLALLTLLGLALGFALDDPSRKEAR